MDGLEKEEVQSTVVSLMLLEPPKVPKLVVLQVTRSRCVVFGLHTLTHHDQLLFESCGVLQAKETKATKIGEFPLTLCV